MDSWKSIPYNKIQDFKPFFSDETLRTISTKNSKKLVFLLCDTVKRLTDDIKALQAQLQEKK